MIIRLLSGLIVFLMLGIAVGCAMPSPQSTPQIIQPDYQRWSQVKEGISEAQVEALLGKPLRRDANCAGSITDYTATYGIIAFDSGRFPAAYEFLVDYHCKDHTVAEKDDPFDGKLSPNGKPTVPSLICPINGQKFDHYPRNTDFRWTPSSGTYPMTYEVQLNPEPTNGWDGPGVRVRKTTEPLLVESWVGKNDGVWRVRAINRLGVSAWSEERTFSFSR